MNSIKLEVRLRTHPDSTKFSKEICHNCFSLLYYALPAAFDKHSNRLSIRGPRYGHPRNLYSLKKRTPEDSIEELFLDTRAHNCLINSGIKTIGQLLEAAPEKLFSIKNLGLRGLHTIKEALLFYNLPVNFDPKEKNNYITGCAKYKS